MKRVIPSYPNLPKTPRRKQHSPRHWLALMGLVGMASFSQAAEAPSRPLKGAASVLEAVAAATATTNAPVAAPLSDAEMLRRDLTNAVAVAETQTPEAAAQAWLAVVDRLAALQKTTALADGRTTLPNPMDLLQSLPPPKAWEALARLIRSRAEPKTLADRQEFVLRMLAQALTNDRSGLTQTASSIEALLLKADKEEVAPLLGGFRSLDDAILQSSDDPKAIVGGVERQLRAVESDSNYSSGYLNLPDLVSILGEAEASPYVKRAVVSKAQSLNFDGELTRALARKIALQSIDELKVPRWDLVSTLDSMELYEAIDRKFTKQAPSKPLNAADALQEMERFNDGSDNSASIAKTYYLMGLIAKGRTKQAADWATGGETNSQGFTIDPGAVSSLAKAGYTRALDDFFYALLLENPSLPYWETYLRLAANTGKTDRMLQLARTAATRPGLPPAKSQAIRNNLYRALLAADQVEEAVKEIRTMIATPVTELPRRNSHYWDSTLAPADPKRLGLTLAQIGKLMQRRDWIDEGQAALSKIAEAKTSDSGEDFQSAAFAPERIRMLIATGHADEAERLLESDLKAASKPSVAPRRRGSWTPTRSGSMPLGMLVSLYHHENRDQDVIQLIEKAPQWGNRDLVEYLRPGANTSEMNVEQMFASYHFARRTSDSFLTAIARALSKTGRTAEAAALVDAILDVYPGDDRAYELLLSLSGDKAMAKLDALFARDPFEERPLIWKALLLHQAGQEEAAEKVARQAISIDPSDGEQGKGDRMRVYAILAEIRAARGDQKEAEFFQGVVKAIRKSEDADDWIAAGLLTRGVKMYEESLQHFQDAYCIQSRLAVHLSELGQHQEAAKHYEKAFELMPDSFGRVESHCFGCESTFAATEAQDLAEKVFTRLLTKNPSKPQLHYLMGYLREQQGRGREALPHFRKALELDPDYLNAWSHLQQIGFEYRIRSTEQDAIALNLLRLDPLHRHTSPNLSRVTDLKKLWVGVETANRAYRPIPKSLLPFPASRDALDKKAKEPRTDREDPVQDSYEFTEMTFPGQSPRQVLSRHQLLRNIMFFGNSSGMFGF